MLYIQKNTIKKIFIKNKFNSAGIGAPPLRFNVTQSAVEKANNNFPKIVFDIVGDVNSVEYSHTFHRILIDTLNKIETTCTMIELNVADEETVFKLIGNSFCNFIGAMYFYIASVKDNCSSVQKKMKHTINVFNKWNKKLIKETRSK